MGLIFICEATIQQVMFHPMLGTVPAGFPSPALDYIEKEISLEEMVVQHPGSTFYVRVKGDSMKDANIPDNAILVVDKSIDVKSNSIVIAWLNGDWCVKRYIKTCAGCILRPANKAYKDIVVTPEMEMTIWGVVTFILVDAQS